jgi:hypothetical protein
MRVEEQRSFQQYQNVGSTPTYGLREFLERNMSVDNPSTRHIAPPFQNPNVVLMDEINDELIKEDDQFLDPM